MYILYNIYHLIINISGFRFNGNYRWKTQLRGRFVVLACFQRNFWLVPPLKSKCIRFAWVAGTKGKANFSERSDIYFRNVQYSSKSKHSKRQCSNSAGNTARSGSCRAKISCSRHFFYVVNLVNVKNVLCFTVWTSLEKDFVDKIILREWYKNTSWNQQSEAYRVGNERGRRQKVKAEKWLNPEVLEQKVVQKIDVQGSRNLQVVQSMRDISS